MEVDNALISALRVLKEGDLMVKLLKALYGKQD